MFAAALDDDDRAELVGVNSLGRAARQRLVKLPDESGLLLTYLRYLTPDSNPIHEKGLEPDVEVEQPEVEFGAPVPTPGRDAPEGDRSHRLQESRLSYTGRSG